MTKMKIEHISVSRHGMWYECKQKYKYKYHLGIQAQESPFYFEYGKIVHKIAEEYVRGRGEVALNEIANEVLKGRIEIEEGVKASSLPLDYKARLPGHLRAIENLTKQIGFDGDLEWPFQMDLDPPNGKLISGVIDRLIPKNEKCFIIDYKTTKRGRFRKNPLSIKHDIQLRTYAWAVREKIGISIDNIRVALYYLEGGNLIAGKFTERAVDEAIKDLKDTYDEIQNTDPNKVTGNVGEWCRRCEYKDMCPYCRR